MSSYNLSSVVAIAKKKKTGKKFKNINLHNLKVQKQPGLHCKFQESQGLHRDLSQNKKKKFSWEECTPLSKGKHLAVVNKMDLYLCYKAHFLLGQKSTLWKYNIALTIFSCACMQVKGWVFLWVLQFKPMLLSLWYYSI